MGQNNATWQMAFAKALAPQFPTVQWLLPQAYVPTYCAVNSTYTNSPLSSSVPYSPLRRVSMNQGMLRPSWFDIWRLPPHPSEYDEQAITESISAIEEIILNQIHSGIDSRRIFLMGFSQGAALSLCVGLSTLNELGGIISLSGWLPHAYRSVRSEYLRHVPLFRTKFG